MCTYCSFCLLLVICKAAQYNVRDRQGLNLTRDDPILSCQTVKALSMTFAIVLTTTLEFSHTHYTVSSDRRVNEGL